MDTYQLLAGVTPKSRPIATTLCYSNDPDWSSQTQAVLKKMQMGASDPKSWRSSCLARLKSDLTDLKVQGKKTAIVQKRLTFTAWAAVTGGLQMWKWNGPFLGGAICLHNNLFVVTRGRCSTCQNPSAGGNIWQLLLWPWSEPLSQKKPWTHFTFLVEQSPLGCLKTSSDPPRRRNPKLKFNFYDRWI